MAIDLVLAVRTRPVSLQPQDVASHNSAAETWKIVFLGVKNKKLRDIEIRIYI